MSAPLDTLVADARGFLGQLAQNNTRDWWQAHKTEYDTKLKAPALELLDHVAAHLRKSTGAEVSTKLFRPHRDIRFSKDKTPYNTHLHMLWSRADAGAYFFGISANYVTAGGGVMTFDKPQIDRWRAFVDRSGDRVDALVANLAAQGFDVREPALKRIPAPFGADHPHGEHLRRKAFSAWVELGDGPGLVGRLSAAYDALDPVQSLLAEAL